MKAEIISIGTELLLGQTINTNAAFIASELQNLGIESYFQSTVGDNTTRIHLVLKQALERGDLIITTGGLGPTPDDLTHKAISSFFNKNLFLDIKVLKQIQRKFQLRGYKRMPAINKKQAYKPKEAKWIPNKTGTANGIIWKIKYNRENKTILTFPGVPSELYHMWNNTAKSYLSKIKGKNIIYSRTLKYTGIGESALAEKINKYFKLQNPTVAPYASLGEVKIRITSKAQTNNQAKKILTPIAKKILKKTKSYYYGEDEETLESLVGQKLISKNKTISVAESCTGGLLSKRLTDVPGSSKYIKLNVITYSNKAKSKILNVPENILSKHGAVSHQVAKSMAEGVRKLSGANWGLSVTGIAGPTGNSKNKPLGLVYFGLANEHETKTRKVEFGSNLTREEIRWLSSQHALNWLRQEL